MGQLRRKLAGMVAGLVFGWIVSAAPVLVSAQSRGVALVVNQRNLVSNISFDELRRIFAGERQAWPGGIPVKLFTRDPGAHEHDVLLKILNMTDREYTKYWHDRVSRGEADSVPVSLPSNGMQKEAIGTFPGAVALVDIRDVKSPMRIVKVDGRLPGQSGYALP